MGKQQFERVSTDAITVRRDKGTATLVAGVATVNTKYVSASSVIQLTIQSLGTVTSPKAVGVTARVAGTSFTITSADLTDTSVIGWVIIG